MLPVRSVNEEFFFRLEKLDAAIAQKVMAARCRHCVVCFRRSTRTPVYYLLASTSRPGMRFWSDSGGTRSVARCSMG